MKCRACMNYHLACACNSCQQESLFSYPACCAKHGFTCSVGADCQDYLPEKCVEIRLDGANEPNGAPDGANGHRPNAEKPNENRTAEGGEPHG